MSVLNTALIMLFLNHRIIILPAAAYLMPLTVIKQLFSLTTDLIKTFIKHCEKIKRIRQHRRMTQKELGELVDLSANRIAQYEMGYRVPKKPLLNQIAEALRVSPLALSDGGNGPANDILEQLFWLDEEQPGVIKLVPTERGTARYNANPDLALHYDDNDNWPPRSPVAMWFDDTILDDFLKDWAAVQKKLYAGEITQAEYFEWKIMWPSVL